MALERLDPEQAAEFRGSQGPDLSRVSMDDLVASLNAQPEEPTPEPEVELDPEPEQEAPEPEPPAQEAPAEEAPAEEAEVPEWQTAVEELRLKLAEQEAATKHFEALAGRYSGEAGWLRRRMESLDHKPAESQPDEDAPPEAPAPAREPVAGGIQAWAVNQAVRQSVAEFQAGLQNEPPEVMQRFMESVATHDREAAQRVMSQMTDPNVAADTIRWMLQQRYWSVKRAHAAEQLKQFEAKRADQAAKLKERKQAAQVTTTKGQPQPRRTVKRPEDMTDAELRAALGS